MTNYSALKSTGAPGFPPGFIIPWANNSLPTGFLLCDGSNVSRTTYADLFAAIGTTYGAGDGSSTFGLPSLDGRQLLFQAASSNNVGTTAGSATIDPTNHVTLTNNQGIAGNVTVSGNIVGHQLNISEIPTHTHNVNLIATDDGGITNNARFSRSASSTFNATVASDSTGGSGSHAHNHNIAVNANNLSISGNAALGYNSFDPMFSSTRLKAVIKT
jgi:microcystin-dependent protein